jgi:hypothetical protein
LFAAEFRDRTDEVIRRVVEHAHVDHNPPRQTTSLSAAAAGAGGSSAIAGGLLAAAGAVTGSGAVNALVSRLQSLVHSRMRPLFENVLTDLRNPRPARIKAGVNSWYVDEPVLAPDNDDDDALRAWQAAWADWSVKTAARYPRTLRPSPRRHSPVTLLAWTCARAVCRSSSSSPPFTRAADIGSRSFQGDITQPDHPAFYLTPRASRATRPACGIPGLRHRRERKSRDAALDIRLR